MGEIVPPSDRPGNRHAPDERDQVDQLARGIINLDFAVDALNSNHPEGSLASTVAEADALKRTVAAPAQGYSPGMALARIIGQVAARASVWGDDWLRGASQRFQESGTPLTRDATFFTDIHVMNVISHALEERVIATRLPCEVYAGFQRLSLLRPQLPRYHDISRVADWVSVFGLRDRGADEVLREVASPRLLPFTIAPHLGTGLEQFWFVVIRAPQFASALLARHTEGDLWSRHQAARKYSGLWTFDPHLVGEIVATLRHGARLLHFGA